MKVFGVVTTVAALGLLLSGCASDSGETTADDSGTTTTSSKGPDIAIAVKPAPEQDPNGTKPVLFDPCAQIGDSTIAAAGFSPDTRQRSDQVHTGYAFISCTFDRQQSVMGRQQRVGSLTVSSTNITLDQFRQRQNGNFKETTVNGQQAVISDLDRETCNIVIPGPDASIDLQTDSVTGVADWKGCDHLQEIASTIQSALPKN